LHEKRSIERQGGASPSGGRQFRVNSPAPDGPIASRWAAALPGGAASIESDRFT